MCYFDSISGFTTTGLTAFQKTNVEDENKREISKIDAQPNLIHVIRATYLWIGGLGIMFFYLYFTPIPSLMMSMGYEIPAERSLPRFIRLESLSFSLVYCIITAIGILLLFLFISTDIKSDGNIDAIPEEMDNRNVMTYSVVLVFSSISTGGFSPGSTPIDEIEIPCKDRNNKHIGTCQINYPSLMVLMVLMFFGAMPIFSMHRPLKFFRRWKIFVLFLLPVGLIAVISYLEDMPEISLYRSFDTISAFTTTGLYTSQSEKDLEMPSRAEYRSEYKKVEYISEYEKSEYISKYEKTEYKTESEKTRYEVGDEEKKVREIYEYRGHNLYIITLMFIGGAAYSTAGGWGFFSFWCIISAVYLIITGKLERVLTKYIIGLILSFMIFFSIFTVGTVLCYKSRLFGTISEPEPEAVADYIINSAFYEISALSTVGLMPDYIVTNESIYDNSLAYWTLALSMLIGRLYYIIFPFIVSLITPEEGI